MTSGKKVLDTHQKALLINLDQSKYGSFAEIGAGQEVVRWFFRVGGAAGTIAKSISAYDMLVSDSIYGSCSRYVCRQRLEQMLDHEYRLMIERLDAKRGERTKFFVFADTVSARNFQGTNECHGWLGVRFQNEVRQEHSEILIHVRMLDKENLLQQEALGIVGVNLIYAALYLNHDPSAILESLLDSLKVERIEVDMAMFHGPAFPGIDHRLMSLKLVQLGLSDAAMFAANGEVLQPSEVLYKKPILIERGSFRPVCHVNMDMLDAGLKEFRKDPKVDGEEPVVLMEITMKNLMATGEIDYEDFLARAEMIATTGKTVLISDYFEYFRLSAYLGRYTKKLIGVVMGAASLKELFNETYYTDLEGGVLESFGRLFKNDLKLLVYPLQDQKTGDLVTVQNLQIAPDLQKLYGYLVDRGCVVPIDHYDPACLKIFSRDVLAKLKAGDPTWESMVPEGVARVIKDRGFFGYVKS